MDRKERRKKRNERRKLRREKWKSRPKWEKVILMIAYLCSGWFAVVVLVIVLIFSGLFWDFTLKPWLYEKTENDLFFNFPGQQLIKESRDISVLDVFRIEESCDTVTLPARTKIFGSGGIDGFFLERVISPENLEIDTILYLSNEEIEFEMIRSPKSDGSRVQSVESGVLAEDTVIDGESYAAYTRIYFETDGSINKEKTKNEE